MDSEYLTLVEAAALCPGRPSASALWRWARRGVLGKNKQRIRLAHIRVGRNVYTTRHNLDAFFAAVTAADLIVFDNPETQPTPPVKAPAPTQRARQIAAADARLRAAGV